MKQLELGSKSPRRQQLIKELGYNVEVRTIDVEEIYPDTLNPTEVPEFLAKLKAAPLKSTLIQDEILVTSDTIVLLDGNIIGKPKNHTEAIETLKMLSGNTHAVITGVNLCSLKKEISFSTKTEVQFSILSDEDIQHYVSKYNPIDKAGSYGIQEWIGYIGVKGIIGCYYNVIGLPLHDLNKALKNFD